jgi:hypothetical protein
MTTMLESLKRELLALQARDLRVRSELAADDSLFEGYHPRMEDVHRANAVYAATTVRVRKLPLMAELMRML